MMGQKGTTHAGVVTHMEAVRHKVDKSNLTDEHILNTTVMYEGRDQFLNHWICVTPNDEDREVIIERLRARLSEEYCNNVEGFTPFDPLEQFFTATSLKCRLAKSGNFSIHENEKSDDMKRNPVLYERHEITTAKNIEQEEEMICQILQERKPSPNEGDTIDDDDSLYTFDVDISFAGAFICAEGPLASIVCRKLYRCPRSETVCNEVFTKLPEAEHKDSAQLDL